MLKVAFQMDDILNINFELDSTFPLVVQALKRNFEVYYYHPNTLYLFDNNVTAKCKKIVSAEYNKNEYVKLGEEQSINLKEMDIIWLRQDPPFNMSYITSTYFLDMVKNKVLILNDPTEVRNNPEKLIVQNFNKFIPKTLITKEKGLVLDFIKQEKIAVIKPLFEARGGNVFLLKENDPNMLSIIEYFINNFTEPFIVQQFLPNVIKGDKRVIIVDGEVLGCFSRIPKNGIRSNLALGGVAEASKLTEKENDICKEIGPFLKEKGLFFVGADLIDGYLTEINLTSPTGLRSIYNLSGIDLSEKIWDKVLLKIKNKN